MQEWLKVVKNHSGPLFRRVIKGGTVSDNRLRGQWISFLMKKHFGKECSGHSLRRGLVTEAAESNIPLSKIKKLSRHKSVDMVLRYIEEVEGFEESSVMSLSL
jgi:integrase